MIIHKIKLIKNTLHEKNFQPVHIYTIHKMLQTLILDT